MTGVKGPCALATGEEVGVKERKRPLPSRKLGLAGAQQQEVLGGAEEHPVPMGHRDRGRARWWPPQELGDGALKPLSDPKMIMVAPIHTAGGASASTGVSSETRPRSHWRQRARPTALKPGGRRLRTVGAHYVAGGVAWL